MLSIFSARKIGIASSSLLIELISIKVSNSYFNQPTVANATVGWLSF